MKKALFISLALSVASVFAFKALKGKTYTVDAKQSAVVWTGKKVTGEHKGKVEISSGKLNVLDKKLIDGTFVLNLASLTVTDITEPEKNAKLVGHLKNDDFFATDKFPTSQLVITKATQQSGEQYELTGNLTIKGITQPITFPATVKITDKGATARAQITVNRTKYDIKYKSANYFENLGDKAILDDFLLDVSLVATADSKI